MRCKFTDADGRTRAGLDGETQWGPGVSHSVEWSGRLCQEGVLHAYADPLLAVFADAIHGEYLKKRSVLLWQIEGTGHYTTDGLIEGWQTITTLEPIPIPAMSLSQRVEIAIRRSLDVYKGPSYTEWAYDWLDGRNRTAEAALAAKAAAVAWAAWSPTEAAVAAAEARAWAAARAAGFTAQTVDSSERAFTTTPPSARLLEIIYQVMEVVV